MVDSDTTLKGKRVQLGLFETESPKSSDGPGSSETKARPKYRLGQTYQVPVGEVCPNPEQPRGHFGDEELAALADSVRVSGVLQPVLCNLTENGLVLAAGERRLRAAKLAGLTRIPVRIVAGDPIEIGLIENLLRQDLTVVEEAEALSALKKRKGCRLEDLTALTGKAVPTLSEIIAVASLPQEILDECRAMPSIPRDVLVLISRLPSGEEMVEAFRHYKSGAFQRQDLAAHVRKQGKKQKANPVPFRFVRNFSRGFRSLDLDAMERKDREVLRKELQVLMEEISKTLTTLGS
ncbi:MAG: ParB/RepB/Spo0J family partition protein [Geobacteraceae bacterium]|nr:ParB/RepB/Spo0J family partition protein [Geobacteraceae bacterium]